MVQRWVSLVIWAAIVAGAAALGLRLLAPDSSVPTRAQLIEMSMSAGAIETSPRNDLPPPPPPPAPAVAPSVAPAPAGARFKLVGVVAATGNEGVALIAVDGQPARAFQVGETVDGDIVVRNVSGNGAVLGPRGGGAAITLEVSLALAPATGTAPMTTADWEGKLYDGSAQSLEVLRRLGSKNPPLAPRALSAPAKPDDGNSSADDGSWKPPSGR